MLQTTSSKVTASPGATGWVQVHEFTPPDPEKAKLRGELFAVIASDKGGGEIDAISFEREIAGKLKEEYYSTSQEKTFDALRNSVQKIINETGQKGFNIEISCCAFADGVVYSSAFGGGKVLISRDGALASILESSDGVISASGFPKDGDMIIAGTKSFFDKIGLSLKQSLVARKPDSAVEALTPIVYGGMEIGKAGGVIIKFENVAVTEQKDESIPVGPSVISQASVPEKPKVDIGKNITGFIGKIVSKFPKKNIYIRHAMEDEAISQNRKLTLSVGVILLLVLFVSIGFGIRQKRINDVKRQYKGLYQEASSDVAQAINLASVNPEESRQLFLSGEQKLAQIQALKIKDSKIDELKQTIEDSRAAVLGEYQVTSDLFLDLGLLSSGFKGDILSVSGGKIFVLDKGGSRVVSIEISTKKSKVVAGPTVIESPQDLASYEDNVFALLGDGVYLVGSTKEKVIEKTWGGNAFIYAFAGNLYVLDKSGNQIYRYAGSGGDTFGTQQNWLSSSTKANFSEAKGWGMNGAIYVLYPNAKVLKYSLGSPQSFSLSGVSPEIGNIDAISADPDNENVYLLDKAGSRVVVIDKNGKYKAQYINEGIAAANSLAVSESEKKIILLTGEKLLSIELKNN